MAAIVKPIEAKSVHLIQSGQVIVDLCSVVKELVENGLDAGANTIEVRFKNNGLDEIEVQDNGAGIASVNYENVALKHYTSKLSTYDDLSSLQTFGFRGEALSSLCALSTLSMTTAQAHEAPKGCRLEFEISGKLKDTSVVACSKGTTATVQNLFEKLPVRRKELSKNIKREYGKVLGLLHAYACISTNVKFTVKNAMPKGKGMTVFATKSNTTTKENIANVYGAKTLSALVALDLSLDFEQLSGQLGQDQPNLKTVAVCGHISKPVFGEGRQTPDRQMFFVNGRPCGLPQIAKAINEVYKSFNVSQSPFIFADFQMDTSAYDVNVSPDKRTIFLHDATALTESLKVQLTELFDQQDQTVPQSHLQSTKLPAFKQLSLRRGSSALSSDRSPSAGFSDLERIEDDNDTNVSVSADRQPNKLLHDHFRNLASTREENVNQDDKDASSKSAKNQERRALAIVNRIAKQAETSNNVNELSEGRRMLDRLESSGELEKTQDAQQIHVRDFNARMAELQQSKQLRADDNQRNIQPLPEAPIFSLPSLHQPESPGAVKNAFDRMRPKRLQPEVAEITIGDRTITRIIGSQLPGSAGPHRDKESLASHLTPATRPKDRFARGLQKFSASGTQSRDPNLDSLEGDSSDSLGEKQGIAQGQLDDICRKTDDPSLQESDTDSDSHQVELENSVEADPDYVDEEIQKAAEEKRVAELIQQAEDDAVQHASKGEKRTAQALKSTRVKDSVFSLVAEVVADLENMASLGRTLRMYSSTAKYKDDRDRLGTDETADAAEERLSLTVSKSDFLSMHIVGQFNLGFILAVRPQHQGTRQDGKADNDELFIIDQHASDEKYNFERLQAETVVGNQRMVRPALLDLTAVEEEIVIDNTKALEKNGFIIEIDQSGRQEIGKRCRLVSLPLSKEVVFGSNDLDELIHLLAESPMLNDSSPVPRPSKVRKMFAMRACRSSIMIGKTLSQKQMTTILQHLGSMDKPWNCPHGRPTMRHLASLNSFEACLWEEGDGVCSREELRDSASRSISGAWRDYVD